MGHKRAEERQKESDKNWNQNQRGSFYPSQQPFIQKEAKEGSRKNTLLQLYIQYYVYRIKKSNRYKIYI